MPWHQEPMKDVISCDKLRGAANELRSGDFRMGKPTARYPALNQIGAGGEPPELKHLSKLNGMGRPATECESHVNERECGSSWIQSTAGHEESRGKSGGPPSKPKYYLMTDRGAVP